MAEVGLHGERYKKSPELVEKFVQDASIPDMSKKYIAMKPLSQLPSTFQLTGLLKAYRQCSGECRLFNDEVKDEGAPTCLGWIPLG